jgi:hypothetical protein
MIENVAVRINVAEVLSDIGRTPGISTSECLTYQRHAPEVVEKVAQPFFAKGSTVATM